MRENDRDQYEKRIRSALMFALELFEQGARQSGRTVRIIEAATADDLIVVPSTQLADHIRRLIKDRRGDELGRQLRNMPAIRVIEPGREQSADVGGQRFRRVLFDHSWTDQWWRDAVQQWEPGHLVRQLCEHRGEWQPANPPETRPIVDSRPFPPDG